MRAGQPVITPIAVAVPLKVGGKLIGTLDAINDAGTRPFLDHDMHLLQALADYAAIAIENSRLFRELEESKEREKQIIRNVFERYVTPTVVEQLLSSPQYRGAGRSASADGRVVCRRARLHHAGRAAAARSCCSTR